MPRRPLVLPSRRILPLLLLAAPALSLAFPAATSASAACEDARDALRAELESSGHALTPAVARLTRAAVDACPPAAAEGDDGDDPVLAVPLAHPGDDTRFTKPRLFSKDCAFASPEHAWAPDADLTAWETALGAYTWPTYEHGRADVWYEPATDLTVYAGAGEIFGLKAQSDGVGTVSMHGVEIPATDVQAYSGCSPSNPDLCWGSGTATVRVPLVYVVSVLGQFNRC